MTKYHQKVIMKLYHQKHIHKWTGIQLTNDKRNKINLKKYNINDKSINKMCNNNGNNCKYIKNNNKTCKTSLLTSMINQKNEMRKYKSNAHQQKQSQTYPKQLSH
jgi:hypothetical protein